MIDEVHAAGGLMAPQLWHVGAVRTRHETWAPSGPYDSPSGLSRPDKRFGEGMSDVDIADAIMRPMPAPPADAKRRSASTPIELHGARGYLIDTVLLGRHQCPRPTCYGGPELPHYQSAPVRGLRIREGRSRRDGARPSPVIIRISQWKQQELQASTLANTPEGDGGYPGCRRRWRASMCWSVPSTATSRRRPSTELWFEARISFAGWAKKLTGAVTITVGSVGLTGEFVAAYAGEASKPASLDELLRRLERGDFDLVAVGRALLQDPQWAVKVHAGRTEDLMDFAPSAMATLY